jgi:hypothetical protein
MRTTDFAVGRKLFGMLAGSTLGALMLGAAMLAAPAAASTSSGTCTWSGTGQCSLAFTADGQPTDTEAGAVITAALGSQGGPIKVKVLDGSGHLVTGSSAAVTVAIGSNPGSGSLSGTVTVHAKAGVASFANLSIDKPGVGYTLAARSPGITPATSARFTIWGSLQRCSAAACSASSSSATTAGTVTTSNAAPSDFLGAGIGGASFSCRGTYQPVSAPFIFNVLSPSGAAQPDVQLTASLEIDKSLVQDSGHPGAASWQICYASTSPFTARDDTAGTAVIGGVSYHTGLLPDCPKTGGAPCVQARHKDNAGDVVVEFLAAGDPVGRG